MNWEIIIGVVSINAMILLFIGRSKFIAGSDHSFHVNTVNRIKNSGHNFIKDYLFSINEVNPQYPQLFHWLLSFIKQELYENKFKYINLSIKTIEIISFNIFLLCVYYILHFDEIVFLYANVVFNAFPFSYVLWNAKNTGLSARGIGLVSGQIYLYLLIAYIHTGSIWLLISIYLTVFIVLLLSQMATQFVLFSIPIIVIIFSLPELIIAPFLAVGLFYLLMPEVAKNYLIGQFNHKRNFALFMANIFILKSRPSIYRDFVYDFWINLKKDVKKGIYYIYTNPIVELLYGFIFLWFVIYAFITNGFSTTENSIYYLILITIALFVLTSFKWTRFLGEPQRYVEFAIPLISVLFAINYDWPILLILILLSGLIVIIPNKIINKEKSSNILYKDRKELLKYMKSFHSIQDGVCISNDNELTKYLLGIGFKICRPSYTDYFNDSEEFYQNFYDDLLKISPYALKEYYENYQPKLLIINNDIYSVEKVAKAIDNLNLKLIKTFGEFEVYEIQSGKEK